MNRRDLLKRMASAGLLIPFSQSLLQPAFAAGAAGKKLIMLYYPAGTVAAEWHRADLNTWMQEPLLPYKTQVATLKNLNLSGSGPSHREVRAVEGGIGSKLWCGLLSGGTLDSCVKAASLDFQIAKALGQKAMNVAIGIRGNDGSLQLANQLTANDNLDSTNKHGYITPIDNPQLAFDTYIGNRDTLIDNQKLAMLDAIQNDFSSLRAKALAASEQAKADDYANELSNIKQRLEANLNQNSIGSFSRPTANLKDALCQSTGQTAAVRAQLDTLVAGLSLGKTRVATCCFGVYGSGESGQAQFELRAPEIKELHLAKFGNSAVYESHRHRASHNSAESSQSHMRWILSQVAYLLAQLNSANLLDSTLVVLTTELTDGATHTDKDLPWLVAGGGITGGQLDCGGKNHRALLLGLAQAMGMNWTKYGDSNGVINFG